MFIVQFTDGTTVKERQHDTDAGYYWDNLPDKPITALHLTLPGFLGLNPPVVSLSNYDKYYFANLAVADIMTLNGVYAGAAGGGVGTVIGQIIAGIDEEHDLVLWIQVDKKANVTTKRFPISQLQVQPGALKKGFR